MTPAYSLPLWPVHATERATTRAAASGVTDGTLEAPHRPLLPTSYRLRALGLGLPWNRVHNWQLVLKL